MQDNQFLLYGANGYTGALTARYAADFGLVPILAGRRENVIKPLAEKLKLPCKIVSLDDSIGLQSALQDVKVVVHAAGPFDVTAKPMVEACLRTGTHYLDINGDHEVYQMLKEYNVDAQDEGIMI